MNYNYYSDVEYAKVMADKANLAVEFKHDCEQPHATATKVVLPVLNPAWDRGSPEYNDWWYSLIHECYHHLHPEDFELLKSMKIDCQSFLGTVMNLACDFKIENVNRGEFEGRDKIVRSARYLFAKEKIYSSMQKKPAKELQHGILHATWIMDAIARSDYIHEYQEDDLEGMISESEVSMDCLKTMMNDPTLFDEYKGQTTAEDTHNVASHILRLFELDPEDEEMKGKPEDGEEGGGEEGDGDKDGEGEGKEAWVEFAKEALDDHSDGEKKLVPTETEYERETGTWNPTDVKTWKFRGHSSHYSWNDTRSAVSNKVQNSTVSKRIRKELQYLSRSHKVHNQKRGRISRKSLIKTKTIKTPNIFCKKEVTINTKETCVTLLMDCSGSMCGEKYETASAATWLISDTLKSLGIKHNVLGFTSSNFGMTDSYLIPFKGYTENIPFEGYLDKVEEIEDNLCENADGDCILEASRILMQQKEQRKLMFVLSDGRPSAPGKGRIYGDIWKHTYDVVKGLEKKSPVEIYGLGILDDAVTEIYKDHSVINAISELESALFSVLKNKLVR